MKTKVFTVLFTAVLGVGSFLPSLVAAPNDAELPTNTASFTFSWRSSFPGKSTSDSQVDGQKVGDQIILKAVTSYVNWNVGDGTITYTLDSAHAIVTQTGTGLSDHGKGTETLTAYSDDPAVRGDYYDAIKSIILTLRSDGAYPHSAAELETRDLIVPQLYKLLPASPETAAANFTWRQTYPGKSASETTTKVQHYGRSVQIISVSSYVNYPVETGTVRLTLDTYQGLATTMTTSSQTASTEGAYDKATQAAAYRGVVKKILASLQDDIDRPSEALKADRDAAVMVLEKELVNAPTVAFTWPLGETTMHVEASGDDITADAYQGFTPGSAPKAELQFRSHDGVAVQHLLGQSSSEYFYADSYQPAQIQGVTTVIRGLIAKLRDDSGNPSAELKAKRDIAVALLQAHLPASF